MAPNISRVKSKVSAAGWTQASIADYFGVSLKHINNIIHGRERPKVLQIAIARLLEMPAEELWGEWHYSRPRPKTFRRRHVGKKKENNNAVHS